MDVMSYLLGKKAGSGGGSGIGLEIGENEHGRYAKFDNGLLIQSGVLVVEAYSTYVDYTLPIAYKDSNSYEIMANNYYGGSSYGGSVVLEMNAVPQKVDASSGYIYATKNNAAGAPAQTKVTWFTIGFWK